MTKEEAIKILRIAKGDEKTLHVYQNTLNRAIETVLSMLEEQEYRIKQLGKGQQTLIQSRRKWKHRYYKIREKNKDLQKSVEQIYDDYQDIGKMYFDLDEKRQKLIEKLEEDVNELENLNDNYTDADIVEGIYTTRGQIIKAQEILSILKGENHE